MHSNGTRELVPLAAGASAQVLAWRDDKVVKLFRPGFPREAIEQELQHARLAHALGIPTPRAEGLVTLDGRTGIVFERCDGPTMYDLMVGRLRPAAEIAEVFFRLQRALHRFTSAALPRLADAIAQRVRSAQSVSQDVRMKALAALESAPDADSVCHGDYHPINVIACPGGPKVVDWLDAARGEPALDVVRTLVYLRFARPGSIDPAFRADFVDAYLARCRQDWGDAMEGLARWQLPVAVARLAQPVSEAERGALLDLVGALAQTPA